MPIQNFETPFKNYVEGTQQILNKIDIATLAPDATPFEKEIRQNLSRATLLTQEATAKNVESLTSDLLKYFTIKDYIQNPAGGNFTIDEIKQEIENKASKTIGSIRVAQMGVYEGLQLHTAEFEPLTPLLNPLPAFGATEAVSPSDLKAIETFMGDGSIESESDNLRLFLRAIYDVCRGKITENGCKNAILRKLSGTALSLVDRLTDSYRDTDGNIPPNKPSLHEIAHFLERRFLIDSTPEIANARLNSLRQLQNETYTSLEGRIAKLARQASLGEPIATRKGFIAQKETMVFKNALSQTDRDIIDLENKSRAQNNLPHLTMLMAVDHLNKHSMTQLTYTELQKQSGRLNDQNSTQDGSNLLVEEQINYTKDSPRQNNFRGRFNKRGRQMRGNKTYKPNLQQKNASKNMQTEQNGYVNDRQGPGNRFNNNYKGQNFRGQNNFRGNNYRGRFNATRRFNSNQKYNPRNNYDNLPNNSANNFHNAAGNKRNSFYAKNGNNQNKNISRPRVFVTAKMANVAQNACLKCGGFDHRFQEIHRCIYGESNLMTQPCQRCHKGAHHFNICVSGKKPTVGGNRQKLYDPFARNTGLTPGKYTSWDENEVLKRLNSSKNSSEASYNIWDD